MKNYSNWPLNALRAEAMRASRAANEAAALDGDVTSASERAGYHAVQAEMLRRRLKRLARQEVIDRCQQTIIWHAHQAQVLEHQAMRLAEAGKAA